MSKQATQRYKQKRQKLVRSPRQKTAHQKLTGETGNIIAYKRQVKKYLPLLTYLAVDPKNEKAIKNVQRPVLKLIEDICKNCIRKQGMLNKQYKNHATLKNCCDALETLCTSNNVKHKKAILQKGNGLLSSLLAIGIPALLQFLK
jgi:hypothetical protein